jgi:hypothetical protein
MRQWRTTRAPSDPARVTKVNRRKTKRRKRDPTVLWYYGRSCTTLKSYGVSYIFIDAFPRLATTLPQQILGQWAMITVSEFTKIFSPCNRLCQGKWSPRMLAGYCSIHRREVPMAKIQQKVTHCYFFGNVCTISKAARPKAYVCGLSPDEIVGSNLTGGMGVCLLWVLCVVMYRSLRRTDQSPGGVPPTVWCVILCDLETSWLRGPCWLTGGCHAKNKQMILV